LDATKAASEHLFTITKHKAPLQKLMVIQRSCQIVLDALLSHEQGSSICSILFCIVSQNITGSGGADTLLPALVFVLIQANPPQLWTSIQFIRDFRNKSFKVWCSLFVLWITVANVDAGNAAGILFGVFGKHYWICRELDGC
jgi:hypothetical protein